MASLKVALREQQQGTLVTTPQQTVEQFLKQWLDICKPGIRIRTYERYETLARLHIVPVIGRLSLTEAFCAACASIVC